MTVPGRAWRTPRTAAGLAGTALVHAAALAALAAAGPPGVGQGGAGSVGPGRWVPDRAVTARLLPAEALVVPPEAPAAGGPSVPVPREPESAAPLRARADRHAAGAGLAADARPAVQAPPAAFAAAAPAAATAATAAADAADAAAVLEAAPGSAAPSPPEDAGGMLAWAPLDPGRLRPDPVPEPARADDGIAFREPWEVDEVAEFLHPPTRLAELLETLELPMYAQFVIYVDARGAVARIELAGIEDEATGVALAAALREASFLPARTRGAAVPSIKRFEVGRAPMLDRRVLARPAAPPVPEAPSDARIGR